MTTIFKTKELRRACERAAVAVEAGAYFPLAKALRITAVGEQAVVHFYDLEINIKVQLSCEGGALDVIVDAARLIGVLKQCNGKTIEIEELEDLGTGLLISDNGYKARLAIIDIEDLEAMEITLGLPESTADFEWQAKAMRVALNSLQPFISTEETRYYLNGVCLDHSGGVVKAVATDGCTLRQYSVAQGLSGEAWQGIVPTRICLAAVVLFRDNDRSVQSSVDAGNQRIRLVCGDTIITAKLIDGKYPDWVKVIPDQVPDKDVWLRFNRGHMIAALHKLMALKDGRQFGVLFFKNGERWCVGRKNGGDEVVAGLKVHQTPNDTVLEFGVDACLLDRALSSLAGSTLMMRLSQPQVEKTYFAPIVLSRDGHNDSDDGIAIIMPMRDCKIPGIKPDIGFDASPKPDAQKAVTKAAPKQAAE